MRTRAQTKRIEANKTSLKIKSHPAVTTIKKYNGPRRSKIFKLRQFANDLETVGEQQAMLRGASDALTVFRKIKSKNFIMKHEISELWKTQALYCSGRDIRSTIFNRNKQYYANMKSYEKFAYSQGAAMYKTMMFRKLMKNKFLQMEKENLEELIFASRNPAR
jgi:hypothetical protein